MKVPFPYQGTHPLMYSLYNGVYTDDASDTIHKLIKPRRKAPTRGFVNKRMIMRPLDILNGFFTSLCRRTSTSGRRIEPASQYLKNNRKLKYILKPKSNRNKTSLREANLRNHKSKSRDGFIHFSKLISTLEIWFCTFDMFTLGICTWMSSGVKFEVSRENAARAAVDLAIKL